MSENDKDNTNDAPGLGGGGAELDLGPIKALLQEYYDKYAWAGAKTEQLLEGIAALVAEVERLRGAGLKEYSWDTRCGYSGGIVFTVVARNSQEALEYGKKYLTEWEFKEIQEEEPDISDISPKGPGYYEYHIDAGG